MLKLRSHVCSNCPLNVYAGLHQITSSWAAFNHKYYVTVSLINLVSNLCFHPIPMDWIRQLCGECKHNQFWEQVPGPARTLLLA